MPHRSSGLPGGRTMADLIAAIAVGVMAGLLTFSGLGHAIRLASFRVTLQRQGVWPSALEWPVVVTVSVLELGIGLLAVVGIIAAGGGGPWLLRWACALASGLYATFAAFGLYLLRTRPDAPCGCSIEEET